MRLGLVPTDVKIVNETDYPDGEVERLVRAEVEHAELRLGVTITVAYRPKGDGYASGYWRSYWYADQGEDRPQIMIRLPRPGVTVLPYLPYSRKREEGKRFERANWQEALVSVAAHEIEHARQHQAGERPGRRKSGRRRSQVELRCDLAAYRAWLRYRERAAHLEMRRARRAARKAKREAAA